MNLPQAVTRMTGRAFKRCSTVLSLDLGVLSISTGDGLNTLRCALNLALDCRRLEPGWTLLRAPWRRFVSHKGNDLACQDPILVVLGVRENGRDLLPRIKCCLTARLNRDVGCCSHPVGPQSPFFPRLHLPEFFPLAIGPPSQLPRSFSVDPALLQLLGEDLSPATQIGLARIEPLAVLGFGLHRQVDMRMGLMVVQHHHIAVIGELALRELPGPRSVPIRDRCPAAWTA